MKRKYRPCLQPQEILGKRLPSSSIVREIETALRALETIVPDANAGQKLTEDDTDTIGPEWLADLYAVVSRAAPGIPWREFLDMPLAAATHLAAASHRANGGRTERPMDWASALEQMVDFRESDESGNKLLQQCGQSDTEQR